MGFWIALLALIVAVLGFFAGRTRAFSIAASPVSLHSLPSYHGLYVGLVALLACTVTYVAGFNLSPSYAGYAAAAAALVAGAFAASRITLDFRARNLFERMVLWLLVAASAIAILTTIGIVLSVLYESLRFFAEVPFFSFLFGTEWAPTADPPKFGIIPILAGTLLITLIAIIIAGPLGLMSAVYLAEYATPTIRAVAKPVLELLAGIPTVVLGFFAALTVAPLIRNAGESIGLDVASESALAAGVVMGMMIVPLISSLSDDVINAVPQTMRDGSYALGATKSETIRRVVLPAALPGIVSAFILAISRAIGETMIVVMAAGLAANLTFNPLSAVTTVTVQIATLLVGDQEFDSAKTLAAFALGLILFVITLGLNYIALRVVRKYKEQYD
jgi:phosphate transport system permease protein